jgi:hypothetical protein
MPALTAANMNMNMNMNMSALGLPSVAPAQVRFNTADYRKLLLAVTLPPVVPSYPVNWDPDLKSYVFLEEFLQTNPGWFAALNAPAVIGQTPIAAGVNAQLLQVLNVAPDREDRFAEIIHQHDAEGAISYFLGMLMIDPSRHPRTYLLIRVARRIGEHVTMLLKNAHMIQRPSQLCPAVVPMIDPPATPAFPAGHALQARLIARCLQTAWAGADRVTLLDYLAHRIGENRVIAGVHYPRDIDAGVAVANACLPLMQGGAMFQQLMADATAESQ